MLDSDESDHWPYVEALPRFNILTLGREWRRGARVICWEDQDGERVGHADIVLDDTGLDVTWGFDDTEGYVDASDGTYRLDIVRRDDGNRGQRLAVICPGCDDRKEVLLFFEYRWRCRKCHSVKSLSNRLDQETRQYLRLEAHRDYVNGKRPKGVHHSTYAKHVDEYKRLKKEWGRRPARSLRREHLYRIGEVYYRIGEIPPLHGVDVP